MGLPHTRRAIVQLVSVVAVLLCDTRVALGQAWVPPQGEGSVSVVYSNALVTQHYLKTTRYDLGQVQAHDLIFDLSYGVTDRLAVRLSLPWVTTKYDGTEYSHTKTYDNGRYHSAFQDVRLDVRYNASSNPALVVTPFATVIVPSHDYTFFAHSAPGRRLRELQIGTYLARTLDPVLPNAFLQARVGYGFVEKVLDIPRGRAYLDVEFGYFVSPRVRVFTAGSGMLTRGGIELPAGFSKTVTESVFEHHDQIGHENVLNIGAGGTVSVTRRFDVFASFSTTKAARNAHALNRGLSAGVTWRFRTGSNPLDVFGEEREQAVARCVCEKRASR